MPILTDSIDKWYFIQYRYIANGNIAVLLGSNIAKINAKFFDINGFCLFDQTFFDTEKLSVPISSLPNGAYILKISDLDKGEASNYKFVKM